MEETVQAAPWSARSGESEARAPQLTGLRVYLVEQQQRKS